ncbi:MAG: PHP domain-containing protein [Clostridia bacterium]|nr:PHP domain-containing protein [Clostridia bacterium]
MKICDLHNHSIYSDGSITPYQLVKYAKEKGLCAVALTDHNTVDGLAEMKMAGKELGLEAVLGSELTTEYKGKEIHLLALLIKEESLPKMEDFLKERLRLKDESNRDLSKRLTEGGYPVDLDQLKKKYGKNINRAHFARALIDLGVVSTTKEAFDTLLKEGGEFYKSIPRPDVCEAIRLVRGWQAVPVIAHPLLSLSRQLLEELLPKAKAAGLAGLEVYYPDFTKEETEYLEALCDKYDLIKSGGSDFHGDIKTHSDLATATTPYENYEKLKNAR